MLSTLHIKQCTMHLWRRWGSHYESSIRCLNSGRSCASIWMYNNVPNHRFFYLVRDILLSLACPRLQGCALKIVCPNYPPKAIHPKPYPQNHTPKAIRPKSYPKIYTPKAKPYSQNNTPKTIHPKPSAQSQSHMPKAISAKPCTQNHTPKGFT